MGAMLLYFPKDLLADVSSMFNVMKPSRLDYFIYNYLDYELRHKPITKEIAHHSIILEHYSKGKKSIRNHKFMLK